LARNPWANGNSGLSTSGTTPPAGVNTTSQIPGTAEINTGGEDGRNATHGTIVLTLKNVLYAPTAKVNVLSIHALSGVRWEFDSLAAHGTVEGLREVRGVWIPQDQEKCTDGKEVHIDCCLQRRRCASKDKHKEGEDRDRKEGLR
jgi:hypothetical protein